MRRMKVVMNLHRAGYVSQRTAPRTSHTASLAACCLDIGITRWHGRTTTQVDGKVRNLTPAPSKTPELIVT